MSTALKVTFSELGELIKRMCAKEAQFVLQIVTFLPFHVVGEKLNLKPRFSSVSYAKKDNNCMLLIVDDSASNILPENRKIIYYSNNLYTEYLKVILVEETTRELVPKQSFGSFEKILPNLNDKERLLLFLIYNNENRLTFDTLRKEASKIDEAFENALFCYKLINNLEIGRFICRKGKRYAINASRRFIDRILEDFK